MPEDEDEGAAAPARRHVSRRALIGGVASGAALLAAAAVAGTAVVLPRLGPAPTTSPTSRTAGDGLLADRLLARPGFTVAHRGGSLDWPEMSMAGYRNAVALGVNALEISLARTSDGVWFGLHDKTLDRTSGTSGFVASEHPWSEVEHYRITAAETSDPSQPAQPYLRFEELVAAYARTHTIFVDPKVVPVKHFGELFALMARAPHPTDSFVAKGYCTADAWPTAARARGYRSWGYYYGSEVTADPTLLAKTQLRWTWLGLDYQARPTVWSSFHAAGKPVLAHIVPSRAAADASLALGASGLIVSGVREVLAG